MPPFLGAVTIGLSASAFAADLAAPPPAFPWTGLYLGAGAFDDAGDAWSFTYGATAEWKQDWWTARAGICTRPAHQGGRRL